MGTSSESRSKSDDTKLVCAHCDRAIAWCSFCDEVDCPDPSCYPCTVMGLEQSIGPLHEHGG
jgi:hypothetical protein